jgi:hypothetical protein
MFMDEFKPVVALEDSLTTGYLLVAPPGLRN